MLSFVSCHFESRFSSPSSLSVLFPLRSAGCAALVCKYIFGVQNIANPSAQDMVMAPLTPHDDEEQEGDDKEELKEPEQPAEEGQEVVAENKASVTSATGSMRA